MFDERTGKLPVGVELLYDGVWNDITDDVDVPEDIQVSRGRQDWASQVDPATCTLLVDNRTGKYTPRNPRSPLYGKINRNTPIRVRIGKDLPAGLQLSGVEQSYAYTPNGPTLNITGDIDVRADITPTTWRPAQFMFLAAKYQISDPNRAWTLILLPTGAIEFAWCPAGTLASRIVRSSTVAVPADTTRLAVRATLDVNNGASGHTVTFYTAPTMEGPWTQLGAPVVTAGTTSIMSGTADVTIGTTHGGGLGISPGLAFSGLVQAFELRNGIDGTVVTDPVFNKVEPKTVTFTDSVGLTWNLWGSVIIDEGIRFRGEVTSWPTRWDGPDYAWVPIEAKGVFRRLGQGDAPFSSAMYRGLLGADRPEPKAYWPAEEGDTATSLASALDSGSPMTISGEVDLAAYSDFDSSLPIPTIKNGSLNGVVPPYEPYTPDGTTTYIRAMALAFVPGTGVPNTTVLMRLVTTGSASRWYLHVNPNGSLRIVCYDNTADLGGARTAIVDSTFSFDVNGRQIAFGLYLIRSGSNVEWQVFVYRVGDAAPLVGNATLSGHSLGRAASITIGGGSPLTPLTQTPDLNGTAVGHIVVLDTPEFWDMLNFIRGWNFEFAMDRIIRLCDEQDVQLTPVGGSQDTQAVGPQRPNPFLNLIQSAADLDMGILYEPIDSGGLAYRTRRNMYNQPAKLALDYAAGHVSAPFEPVDDDQALRNDVTVSREKGSSARVVQANGPLSILDPPHGVGRYDEALTLDAGHDSLLGSLAGWRVHLGTVDEYRFPQIRVDLAANPDLAEQVLALELGDRLTIDNLPDWLPPGQIEALIQGWTERINTLSWDITFNCTPASPWNVGVVGDATFGKADTSGSQIASAISDTDTSIQVAITAGPLWTTDAAQMPIDIAAGGEVMRVTAVSGTSSPQTFTVTRGVNGITTSHAAGTGVRLARPAVVAL